jgi:hypothetical protein
MSEAVVKASQAILDTFNRCINRAGLTQFVARDTDDVYEFVWHLKYVPHGNRDRRIVAFMPTIRPNASCKLNGKAVPKTLNIGPAGLNVSCNWDPCKTSLLTGNSEDAELFPVQITIPKKVETPSGQIGYKTYTTKTFDMKAPISIVVPRGQECLEKHEGNWWPHKFNRAWVLLCPGLTFTEGQMTSKFDTNHYEDNDGSCTYIIECRPKPAKVACSAPSTPKGAGTVINK